MGKRNHRGKLRCKGPGCGKCLHLTDGKPLHRKKSISCPFCRYSNIVIRKGNGKIILV